MNRILLLLIPLLVLSASGCRDERATGATKPAAAATTSATPVSTTPNSTTPNSTTPDSAAPAAAKPAIPALAAGVSDASQQPASEAAPAQDGSQASSWQAYQQSLQKRCNTDADCTVKNVGNCCGYFPQCVHRDVQPSPATIKAICEREQRQSICGFEEPAGCQCVQGQCQAGDSAL